MRNVENSPRPAREADAWDYAAHIVRHVQASGHGGEAHYAPIEPPQREDVASACQRRWTTPLAEVGWGRAWLLFGQTDGVGLPGPSRSVLGHLELRGASIPAAMHRAELQIGLEPGVRGRGLGAEFLRVAIAWACTQTTLRYIDLKVFSHNQRARKLYRQLNFCEVGLIREAFIMPDGTAIDDLLMALPIRTAPHGDSQRAF